MPWNSPSSQPTSWACAMRSSASVGHVVGGKGERQALELLAQLRREALRELLDRPGVHLAQPQARGVVQGRGPHLLQQLLDHGADPHDLGRLLDHVGGALLPRRLHRPVGTDGHGPHGLAVRADDDDLLLLGLLAHDRDPALPARSCTRSGILRSMTSTATAFDVTAVRADFPALAEGLAHFDGPGGTQVPAAVSDAVADAMRSAVSNRHGPFASSRRADALVDAAREAVADLVGGDPAGVVLGQSMTGQHLRHGRRAGQDLAAG
jgi:selenocysteine lyase/cysteine desulfurase